MHFTNYENIYDEARIVEITTSAQYLPPNRDGKWDSAFRFKVIWDFLEIGSA